MVDMVTVSYRKRHCQISDIIKTPEFVSSVDKIPRKSMRSLARELQVDKTTIRCVVHEDFR